MVIWTCSSKPRKPCKTADFLIFCRKQQRKVLCQEEKALYKKKLRTCEKKLDSSEANCLNSKNSRTHIAISVPNRASVVHVKIVHVLVVSPAKNDFSVRLKRSGLLIQ